MDWNCDCQSDVPHISVGTPMPAFDICMPNLPHHDPITRITPKIHAAPSKD